MANLFASVITSLCLLGTISAPCACGQTSLPNLSESGGDDIQKLQQSELAGSSSSHSTEVRAPGENIAANRVPDIGGQGAAPSRVSGALAIRYVSKDGSDSNDGLSWAAAKRTIYEALVSLPGGGSSPPTAGSGTVYVGPSSSASSIAGGGIWILSKTDPNYSRPPSGWLRCYPCSVNIIGIGNVGAGPNGHKPRAQLIAGNGTDRNHPAIWLSGTQQPLYIANLAFGYNGRAVVLGECSNNLRDGTCGISGTILDNVAGALQQTATNGPCTDIVSNVFWLWLRDYGCAGNAYIAKGAPSSDNSAAILIDASAGQGSGLISITDTNLAGGGIKVLSGANGMGLYAHNVIQEGDFSHALPPTVWFAAKTFPAWGAFYDAILDNIQTADGKAGGIVIQNDGSAPGPTVLNSSYIQGPAVVMNPLYSAISTISPYRQGQTGFFNKYVVGQTDVARRIAGFTPSRFVNKASSDTATWRYTNIAGSQTLKQGLTDPFGGKKAASISSNSSTEENISLGSCTPYTPNPGDWIVVGVWGIGMSPGTQTINPTCYGYSFPKVSASYAVPGREKGDGQWQYQWQAFKVASGSATQIGTNVLFSKALTPTLYGPTLYIIPSGTLSDNEVLEFASSMNSLDSNCRVGQICNLAGHPVVVSSLGTLSNCSSVTSPAKCDSAPAGSFVLSVDSTAAKVNTTAVTADSQILIIEDASLGTKLGITCNKASGRTYMITERVAGQSFTIRSSLAPADHPACLSFQLLN